MCVCVCVCRVARAPFVHAVCQCAGLDSRGFNTRYRGDCCSLSACSTQPNDRLSSHRGAQPPFVERRVPRTSSTARTRPGKRLLGTYLHAREHFRPSIPARDGMLARQAASLDRFSSDERYLDDGRTGRGMLDRARWSREFRRSDAFVPIGRQTDLSSSKY